MGLDIFPVVLSGGSGTRLWPLSRAMYPKQFIRSFNGSNESYLGATLKRLAGSRRFNAPILLCNSDHRFLVREELERSGTEARAVILEPTPRNTAPAVAVAALAAISINPDAILAVMPSDHVIGTDASFIAAVERGADIAARGYLVLFGIQPNEAHTGYGYIRRGSVIADGADAFTVTGFTEKPNLETAQQYIASGDFLWNSGIFVLHAQTFIDELKRLAPNVLAAARQGYELRTMDLGFERLAPQPFAASPNISIDYAVMEKTNKAVVMPLAVGWNDVGSWASLWEISPRDSDGNFACGEAIFEDSQRCYVHTEKAIVATIGVEDLVIVDTPDALLVADRNRTQDVSSIVKRLKSYNRKEHEQHVRSYRPWGFFETLSLGSRFQVKLLHVKPGAKLSMQMHHHRSEHWIVVQGTASVEIDGKHKLVRENESVYIFATHWHRLENPGKVPLELIEVQIGSYLGEDDICRTEDIYNRAVDETK